MATRTGTQRRTRNSQKALMDDNDFHLMFSQLSPNKSQVNQHIEEDDDFMLFLSQGQQPEVSSCESTVNGLVAFAASMRIENKLKYAKTKEASSSDITENLNYDRLQKKDHTVNIKHLPFGQNDTNDVKKLITDGLRRNIQVRNIHRASALYNNAGVLTVEL